MDKEGRSPLLSAQDPFYAVRDALDGELRTLRVKFDSWKGLLHSVDTSADVGFKMRHEEVKRDIIKVGELLRKVRASVLNVEQNRGKFSHIDDRELAARKGAVDALDSVRVCCALRRAPRRLRSGPLASGPGQAAPPARRSTRHHPPLSLPSTARTHAHTLPDPHCHAHGPELQRNRQQAGL